MLVMVMLTAVVARVGAEVSPCFCDQTPQRGDLAVQEAGLHPVLFAVCQVSLHDNFVQLGLRGGDRPLVKCK